jgi:hypothetical protein
VGDGLIGGEKSRRQHRFPRCAAAEVLQNRIACGAGWLGAPQALDVGRSFIQQFALSYILFESHIPILLIPRIKGDTLLPALIV